MIHFAVFLFSTGIAGGALFLLSRLRRLNRAVAVISQAPGASDGLPQEVTRLVLRAIDDSLLPQAGQAGLADIEIHFREFQDPYRNLDELLNQVAKTVNGKELGDVNQFIKNLFQIQSSLGIPFSELNTGLRILEARLTASAGSGKSIARIEIVLPGALLDTKKMMAINNGTHVKQPLGVVAVDRDGKILNKAKVICA